MKSTRRLKPRNNCIRSTAHPHNRFFSGLSDELEKKTTNASNRKKNRLNATKSVQPLFCGLSDELEKETTNASNRKESVGRYGIRSTAFSAVCRMNRKKKKNQKENRLDAKKRIYVFYTRLYISCFQQE